MFGALVFGGTIFGSLLGTLSVQDSATVSTLRPEGSLGVLSVDGSLGVLSVDGDIGFIIKI